MAGTQHTSDLLQNESDIFADEQTSLMGDKSNYSKRKDSILHTMLNVSHSWLTILTYFWSFVVVGIFLTLLGPAFPDLKRQADASASQMSALFLANGILYALGSVLFGVILERFEDKIHLFNALILGICAILILSLLIVSDFLSLFVVCATYSLFVGALDTCGNVAMMAVIREEPELDYTMQLLQACVSGGAVVGSLFTLLSSALGWKLKLAYILIALVALPPMVVSYLNLHKPEMSHRQSKKAGNYGNPSSIENSRSGSFGGQYYSRSLFNDSVAGASASLVLSDPNAYNDGNNNDKNNDDSVDIIKSDRTSDDNAPNSKYMLYSIRNTALVLFSAMSMICAMSLEIGFGAYLTQFTIEHVRSGNAFNGRLFEFIYYTCGCLSRASAALNWISVTKLMMMASISNVIVSGIFIYFNKELDSIAICSGLFGLTITPVFGSLFTFVEFSNVEVTGLPSGMIMLGAGIGASLGPSIIGLTTNMYGYVWFPYLMFFYSIALCICLIPMILIGKFTK